MQNPKVQDKRALRLKVFVTISVFVLCSFVAIAQQSNHATQVAEDERWVLVSDTLTLDQLLDVAVKYFELHLTDDGKYGARLCAGFSMHAATQPIRDKKLESFCAGVIMENSQGEDGLHAEFINAVNEVAKMNLGLNKEERLFRAQGALCMLMNLNPKLREVFRSEYEKQKHMLHFYLLPDN